MKLLTKDQQESYKNAIICYICKEKFENKYLKDKKYSKVKDFFLYLGFLSQPFTNHRTAGKGGWHFFSSSLPLPPASQTLRH